MKLVIWMYINMLSIIGPLKIHDVIYVSRLRDQTKHLVKLEGGQVLDLQSHFTLGSTEHELFVDRTCREAGHKVI